jgi:hypothetical protein
MEKEGQDISPSLYYKEVERVFRVYVVELFFI